MPHSLYNIESAIYLLLVLYTEKTLLTDYVQQQSNFFQKADFAFSVYQRTCVELRWTLYQVCLLCALMTARTLCSVLSMRLVKFVPCRLQSGRQIIQAFSLRPNCSSKHVQEFDPSFQFFDRRRSMARSVVL